MGILCAEAKKHEEKGTAGINAETDAVNEHPAKLEGMTAERDN